MNAPVQNFLLEMVEHETYYPKMMLETRMNKNVSFRKPTEDFYSLAMDEFNDDVWEQFD